MNLTKSGFQLIKMVCQLQLIIEKDIHATDTYLQHTLHGVTFENLSRNFNYFNLQLLVYCRIAPKEAYYIRPKLHDP